MREKENRVQRGEEEVEHQLVVKGVKKEEEKRKKRRKKKKECMDREGKMD